MQTFIKKEKWHIYKHRYKPQNYSYNLNNIINTFFHILSCIQTCITTKQSIKYSRPWLSVKSKQCTLNHSKWQCKFYLNWRTREEFNIKPKWNTGTLNDIHSYNKLSICTWNVYTRHMINYYMCKPVFINTHKQTYD